MDYEKMSGDIYDFAIYLEQADLVEDKVIVDWFYGVSLSGKQWVVEVPSKFFHVLNFARGVRVIKRFEIDQEKSLEEDRFLLVEGVLYMGDKCYIALNEKLVRDLKEISDALYLFAGK